MNKKSPLPLLLSEKTFLTAAHYNLNEDFFTGIIESKLHHSLDIAALNQSYFSLISRKTSLNILFFRKSREILKSLHPVPFLGVQEPKTREELSMWKRRTFDLELGPLHEIAVVKTFFNSFLYFKFHHVIMDGFSLFYFFQELCLGYKQIISTSSVSSESQNEKKLGLFHEQKKFQGNQAKSVKNHQEHSKDNLFLGSVNFGGNNSQSDFLTYKKMINQHVMEETQNHENKKSFWINYIEKNKNRCPDTREDFFPSKESSDMETYSVFLTGKYIRKLYQVQSKNQMSLFSLFTAIYSKALQNVFDIPCVSLRVASSSRQSLKSEKEQSLLANLSCGFPLIIKPSHNQLETARCLRTQVREMLKYLPVNPIPWNQKDLISFSKKKKRSFYLSFSYFAYREKEFFGSIRKFHWPAAFLDLALFFILSEKRTLLTFSHRKTALQTDDLNDLIKSIKKEILAL